MYDRNHYFGFRPIPKPKPKMVDTFGRYRNRYRNHISKGKSICLQETLGDKLMLAIMRQIHYIMLFLFFAASFFRFPTLLVLQNKCRHFSCIWSLFLVLGRLFSEIYFNPFPICNHFIKRLFEISPTNLLNKWIEKVNQIII